MSKRSGNRAIVLVGLLLVAVNLRLAFASVSPLLETISRELDLSRSASGLLTTIPVLCMGVFAFFAARIGGWFGLERGILWSVVLIGLATAGRLAGDNVPMLYATTLLVGAGIAVGQALLPAVVKRYFADRAALVTGLYSVGFNVGAALAAGTTVSLEVAFGGFWPAALAFWALLALPAAVLWLKISTGAPREASQDPQQGAAGSSLPWRSLWAWFLSFFFGASSCLYWSVLTWLPPLYQDEGLSKADTGLLLTLFTGGQIFGALVVPVLADRSTDRRVPLLLMLAVTGIGLGAIVLVPLASPWVFTALIGFGIGGLFPLALTLPLDYARDPQAASQLTSMVLGIGYLLAALGPLAIGALRDISGSYVISFGALVAIAAVMLLSTPLLKPERP